MFSTKSLGSEITTLGGPPFVETVPMLFAFPFATLIYAKRWPAGDHAGEEYSSFSPARILLGFSPLLATALRLSFSAEGPMNTDEIRGVRS
jgi:hypothetical protein